MKEGKLPAKKTHSKFNVPNYGAKKRKRVKSRWRKPRGQDSKKRIKRDFMGAEPTIGYKNPSAVAGIRADGKRLMLVHNQAELASMLHDPEIGSYDIVIAHSVGLKKRKEITQLAMSNGIKVANGVRK